MDRAYFLSLIIKKVYRMLPCAGGKFSRVRLEQDTENQAFSIVFVLYQVNCMLIYEEVVW
jgi:hypothetical protein